MEKNPPCTSDMQARCTERLVECFYQLEDYAAMRKLTEALPDGSPVLTQVGSAFQTVGMAQEAVTALLKVTWAGERYIEFRYKLRYCLRYEGQSGLRNEYDTSFDASRDAWCDTLYDKRCNSSCEATYDTSCHVSCEVVYDTSCEESWKTSTM